MISKFISNLSGNGKKLLGVALIFIVIALFDRLLISPTISRLETIDQDIVKEKISIKHDLHFLGYKDKILKESKAVESYLTDKIPGDEEVIAGFLKQLEMLASKSNITLIKVTPSQGVQTKDIYKYQADLECSGALLDVVSFMHLVDTSNDLMKVIKFNFSSKKSDSDDLKSTMSVVKVIISKREISSSQEDALTQLEAKPLVQAVAE